MANESVDGYGPITGTKKHSVFSTLIKNHGNSRLLTEQSYIDKKFQNYGSKGSVRFDVVLANKYGEPICAWDFKTGSAILTAARINHMLKISNLTIPIYMVK